jgi:hypothetical protein
LVFDIFASTDFVSQVLSVVYSEKKYEPNFLTSACSYFNTYVTTPSRIKHFKELFNYNQGFLNFRSNFPLNYSIDSFADDFFRPGQNLFLEVNNTDHLAHRKFIIGVQMDILNQLKCHSGFIDARHRLGNYVTKHYGTEVLSSGYTLEQVYVYKELVEAYFLIFASTFKNGTVPPKVKETLLVEAKKLPYLLR